MDSAASAAVPASKREAPARRPRRTKPPVARRTALQLLVGVLIVGAIPVVSTVRILESNALRNETVHADAALRGQVENGLRELSQLSDDASIRAGDLAGSKHVQRALIEDDRGELTRLAAQDPGVSFYVGRKQVAGRVPATAVSRSVWLTLDGRRVGKIAASFSLDRRLAARLTRDAPRAPSDRLLLIRRNRVLGSGQKVALDGRTLQLGGSTYRAVLGRVPDSSGVRLLAVRPVKAIEASVAPYKSRIRYAAMGSFALLILVALLFAGPILRMLGDFRRVASQASTDALTGLPNRRMFDEELVLEWRRADRVGDSLALILLDLDDFKLANDTHGHQAGDAVLRTVGRILGSGVRHVDLPARYGGEEFGVIVPDADLEGAQKLAERLRRALAESETEIADGTLLRTTASFGVASKGDLESAEDLIAAADEALYEAKRLGKNRVSPEPEFLEPEPEPEPEPERRRRTAPARKKPAATKTAAKPKAKAPAKPRRTAARKPTTRRSPKSET